MSDSVLTLETMLEAIRQFDGACGPPPVRVRECAWLPQFEFRQVRFPRSKRARIRKKWAKDRRNWGQVPLRCAYQYRDPFTGREVLLVSPGTLR